MSGQYVSVEVPFTQFGNRRGFTRRQIEDDPVCCEFYQRFKHCFEYDPLCDRALFVEPAEEWA